MSRLDAMASPMNLSLSGVFAALCTPIDDLGRPDVAAFDRIIEFVWSVVSTDRRRRSDCGVSAFDLEDRAILFARAVQRMSGEDASSHAWDVVDFSTLQLARKAFDSGCDALLLPMPYYFRYSQRTWLPSVRPSALPSQPHSCCTTFRYLRIQSEFPPHSNYLRQFQIWSNQG